ncbi:MAG: 2-phosphosulfolactate phosphatase [Porphyromonas sp.]|nr:2-phosphosulfolactate phosphatase [Porphyromonas sp.]
MTAEQQSVEHRIDIVLSPELLPAYLQPGSVAVIIDVLRASTTIVTALQHKATAIYTLETVEEAERMARIGKLVGAERNVVRCPFARFGNDPAEYTEAAVGGREIYFTTTNGTRTIKKAMAEGYDVVIGTFVNLSAVADYCRDRDVLAVCAGWQGRPSKEDALFAASLCDTLAETHRVVTDVSQMVVELWQMHKGHLTDYIKESNHYPRMVAAGKEGALDYCLTTDATRTLPIARMEGESIKITTHKP